MNETFAVTIYSTQMESEKEITLCENELNSIGLILCKKNLKLRLFNAALDFADLDFVMLSGFLLQQCILNGVYDILKGIVVRLWSAMRGTNNSLHKVPFSIKVRGISTPDGTRDITFKLTGELSEKQKTLVIDRAFDTVQEIIKGNFYLMELTKAHEAFGGANLLRIDPEKLSVSEIDINKEIQKKAN